jgi:hypothetical protein
MASGGDIWCQQGTTNVYQMTFFYTNLRKFFFFFFFFLSTLTYQMDCLSSLSLTHSHIINLTFFYKKKNHLIQSVKLISVFRTCDYREFDEFRLMVQRHLLLLLTHLIPSLMKSIKLLYLHLFRIG